MKKLLKPLSCVMGVALLALGSATAQAQSEERKAGDMRVDAAGIEQVWVPAGCFMMGITAEDAEAIVAQRAPQFVQRELPSEQPQHEVCLTTGYWIDKYEVTNAAFQAFIEAGGYDDEKYWSREGWNWLRPMRKYVPAKCFDELLPDHPRVCVTWYEAEAYANWRGGALPTEAQWEFAARGPENLVYPWGNEWDATKANVENSKEPVAVGSYLEGASWVGALDMAGNVMEWTQDWLSNDYSEHGSTDPTGREIGTRKVERGGWWGSNQFVARTTYRHYEDPPNYQDHHIGFRLVSVEE